MKKSFLIIFLISGINAFCQYNIENLKFLPVKIYDYFTNSQPNCIITDGSNINSLVEMLGENTLIVSDKEYKKYNLSNYNIICIGSAGTNKFIESIELPYNYNSELFIIGDTAIKSADCSIMAISNNPYNISNRLLHISKITEGYNNIFFKNAQFAVYKNDSIIFSGKYYNYLTNFSTSPNEETYQTEFYENTELVKFPVFVSNKNKIDTTFFKVIKSQKNIRRLVNDISNYKVILLGENHYFKTLQKIEENIIFELNTTSYFPYIIIEKPYSYTSVLNEFLAITDDEKSKEYFKDKLDFLVGSMEDSLFYNNLRIWNRNNQNKKIQILCTDIEHNYQVSLDNFLIPRLKSLKFDIPKDSLNSISYLKNLKINFENTNADNIELCRLVENLILTRIAYNEYEKNGFRKFNQVRQKAILKKYEDTLFFNTAIRNNKFIVIAGSEHSGTRNKQHLQMNKEGYYLEYLNPYTKGSTYSIRLLCLSYALDSILVYKDNLKFTPTNYVKMINEYKKAVNNDNIKINDSVFIFNGYDSFTKQILEVASNFKAPFSFKTDDIPLFEKPYYVSFQDMKESEYYKNDYMKYDHTIIIPFSFLIHSR